MIAVYTRFEQKTPIFKLEVTLNPFGAEFKEKVHTAHLGLNFYP